MHKDQKRLQETFIPNLLDRILDNTEASQRDCTVLNRLFLQGPDPLFIMETNPKGFEALCKALLISVADGRKAIEAAHWRGPAVLMAQNEDGTWGLQLSQFNTQWSIADLSDTEKGEALWLILAACSDCTEEEYSEDTTFLERIQRATRACLALDKLLAEERRPGSKFLWPTIFHFLGEFDRTTEFRFDASGIPHATEDHSFYIAYKKGYPACAVHTHGPTFYGTIPTTSLAEQGILVDKEISPQFGLIQVDDSRADYEALPEAHDQKWQ